MHAPLTPRGALDLNCRELVSFHYRCSLTHRKNFIFLRFLNLYLFNFLTVSFFKALLLILSTTALFVNDTCQRFKHFLAFLLFFL